MLQECFLEHESLKDINLRGYRSAVSTKKALKTKGKHIRRGSTILVDRSVNIKRLKERSLNGVELIGVTVVGSTGKTYKQPFDLWTIYNPPNKDTEKTCIEMIEKLKRERKNKLILAGDINCNLKPTAKADHYSINIKKMIEKSEEEGEFYVLNSLQERTTISGSIIDLAIGMGSWSEGFTYPIEVHLATHHFPILVGIQTNEKTNQIKTGTTKRIKRTKRAQERITRKCIKLRENKEKRTGNELATSIQKIMQEETVVVNKKNKQGKKHHWWNQEIQDLYTKKQKHLQEIGRDETFIEMDKNLREMISKQKNESFKKFATELTHTSKSRDVFAAIKMIGHPRKLGIAELTILDSKGKPITEMQEKVQLISQRYQVPLGHYPKRELCRRKETKKKLEEMKKEGSEEEQAQFTKNDAKIAREEMARNKAPGISKARIEDLEMGGQAMDELIAETGNLISESGIWPKVLKNEIKFPIPKGSKTDAIEEDETRPITLLESMDKWLQKMFLNKIKPYISYSETQAGYCLSTDHHTTLVTDFANRQDGAYTNAAFTDISKAFDSIPHDELALAIWESKIPKAYKRILESFLKDRTFKVEARDEMGNIFQSKTRKMLYGVCQGSVFGPILWNIFFDNLLKQLEQVPQNNVESLDVAFADDLTMMASAKETTEAEKALERKLEIFDKFLQERGMEAASHKLKVMCLDPKRRNYLPTVKFRGKILEVVNTHWFLGIKFDKHLSFEDHFTYVMDCLAKRHRAQSALQHAKWGPTQQTCRVLHHAFTESRIKYGILSWYPFLNEKLKNKLEAQNRRSIRTTMSIPKNCLNEALMVESDLDSVKTLAIKRAVSFYLRLGIKDNNQSSLAKKAFLNKKPKWANLLEEIPSSFLEGSIQTRKNKQTLLTNCSIQVEDETLYTQEQAKTKENKYQKILYTDGSVINEQIGKARAAAGFIWYGKDENNNWETLMQERINLGKDHSSYTAEAIAIEQGLKKGHRDTNTCSNLSKE